MKKSFIMLIAVLMLFAAGCKKKEETKAETPKAPASVAAPQAAPDTTSEDHDEN